MIKLTDSFYPPEEYLDSMIAPLDGDLYKSVVNSVYTSPKAFERMESWRSLYDWNYSGRLPLWLNKAILVLFVV